MPFCGNIQSRGSIYWNDLSRIKMITVKKKNNNKSNNNNATKMKNKEKLEIEKDFTIIRSVIILKNSKMKDREKCHKFYDENKRRKTKQKLNCT